MDSEISWWGAWEEDNIYLRTGAEKSCVLTKEGNHMQMNTFFTSSSSPITTPRCLASYTKAVMIEALPTSLNPVLALLPSNRCFLPLPQETKAHCYSPLLSFLNYAVPSTWNRNLLLPYHPHSQLSSSFNRRHWWSPTPNCVFWPFLPTPHLLAS